MLLATAIAAACSALAAVFGYVEFADFVGGGALFLVFLGIGVLAFQVAFGGALWLALVKSPLASLRAIERNASGLESAINRMIAVLVIGVWIAFALQRFELLDPALAVVASVLDARLQAGELNVSVGRVLGFVAVVFGAWLTSRVVVFALEEDVYPRMNLARGLPYALSTLVRYGLLLAGFFAALATLGPRSHPSHGAGERLRPRPRLRHAADHQQLRVGFDPALRASRAGRRSGADEGSESAKCSASASARA